MIERLMGILTGGIVTFLLLWLFDGGRIVSSEKGGWLVAIALGAVANLLWPLIWGIYIRRKVRGRRESAVRAEVERQIAQDRQPPAA